MKSDELPPPQLPDGENGTFYEKFRSEMVAGGATGESETVGGAQGALGMLALVALLVWLAFSNIWIFIFAIGILISVLLHEFGHFITARWAGMKVTQFFMGFGPKLWSFRRGEVEYGVRALPLGAFVRIIGMSSIDEVEPGDEGRTYRQKPYRWRMLVICAGSIMHMIIAALLLLGVYAFAGKPEVTSAELTNVPSDLPAAAAGLQRGDQVTAVDGVPVRDAEEMVAEIGDHNPGDTVTLDVLRDGQPITLTATLTGRPEDPTAPYLGVSSTDVIDYIKHPPLETVGYLGADMWDAGTASVRGLFTVANPVNLWQHLTGQKDDLESRPTTLIGAGQASNIFGEEEGVKGVILILASVNVFIGLFNLFPLLPFDGGHAAIATYERIRSRRGKRYFADITKMMPVALGVLTVLSFMLFTGLYLDITKPL